MSFTENCFTENAAIWSKPIWNSARRIRPITRSCAGLFHISEKSAKSKIQNDIYTTAIAFPEEINMQEELEMITRAAREVYEAHFPGEGGL